MSVEQEEESSQEKQTHDTSDVGDDEDDDDDEDEDEDVEDEDDEEEDEVPDVKPHGLQMNHDDTPALHDVTKIRWPPGSWQDGTRRSAFQPYRPTMVLTNLQRGNIPTETSIPEQSDISLHHRAGQGEITAQDIEQGGQSAGVSFSSTNAPGTSKSGGKPTGVKISSTDCPEYDIDAKDNNGLSALMWASAYGQVPTVQLLLQRGAQIDLEGQEGETSLLLAAAGGHHEVVRLLLSEGASVNHGDEIGNTALMYAAHGDHPHCTNELLLRGADITMANLNGDTAFGIAVKRGSKLAQAVIENYLLTLLS